MSSTGVPISQLPASQAVETTDLIPIVTVGIISGISQATFAVVTLSNPSSVNPFSAGQSILFSSTVGGMTQIQGLDAVISATGGTSGAWTVTVPINSSAFSAFTSGGVITGTANVPVSQLLLSVGIYNATFQSGQLRYAGPNGLDTGSNNFIVGLAIPNPSGTPAPCFLLGSGGGSGSAITACLIQDQAFDDITPGNTLIITSGETQGAGAANGGPFYQYGGASFGGEGGLWQAQGGTSANGAGGLTVLTGGNATGSTSAAVPGDVFVIGGQVGMQGANTHLIMTILNALSGVNRHRANSTIIWDEFHDGSWYFYGGNGYGSLKAPLVSGGTGEAVGWLTTGLNATVPLAKLTSGGTQGSITYINGMADSASYVAPT
jgi:hypothetical protein